mmetsp:Transcript_54204/g.117140  ORF Transcript_54204/g.117140 Transcript_54204/m.117140 type:complete len:379 (+) Transcript_54204:123-1259(+)
MHNRGWSGPPEKQRRLFLTQGYRAEAKASLHPQLSSREALPSLHPQLGSHEAPASLHPQPSRNEASLHLGQPHQGQKSFMPIVLMGKGSFGSVHKARVVGSRLEVAVKTVKLKESAREIQVLTRLRGLPNIVTILGSFKGNEATQELATMNIVLEFVADTLQRIIRHHRQLGQPMLLYHVILYGHQMLQGLASLVTCKVVHRDIKPSNLLVDPGTWTLKICDFGTAKLLEAQEPLQPYACSRFYRAPELILSSPKYTEAVDLWSAGCVVAEMLIGQPIFAGKDGVDQLVQICEVLGTPSPQDFQAMNPNYNPSAAVGFSPQVEPLPWEAVLGNHVPAKLVELVSKLLQFNPDARPRPPQAMSMLCDLQKQHLPGRPGG